uniref:UDP-glucose 6-dehydrogenase n=1 Tax=Leptospirillum ferrodiazotrophum TaxID=412449 RepID=C6HZU2_9BACT|nr:MAG: UDP-glucose 6-dehydrogenase [Leptospirillum ferrodiazotrophum]
MKLCVVGSGYVGLVTAVGFAEMGHDVVGVDNDVRKVESLSAGRSPIYEPGLEELLLRNMEGGRLSFTTDLAQGMAESLFCFIAVGTPNADDGSADLGAVLAVARQIARSLSGYRVVVVKSTVPVGTSKKVDQVMREELGLAPGVPQERFDVVSNPEFLKEGSALEDVLRPDRVVVGVDNPRVAELMKELYAPFTRNGHPVYLMDVASAELTKYAANAFLATKISFINKMAELCDASGADIMNVRLGMGSDRRIGMPFLYAGVGYGGSCFPKDVKALIHTGEALGIPMGILKEVEAINARQKEIPLDIIDRLHPGGTDLKVAIWGGAFKAETDDIREASALVTLEGCLARGHRVALYDPEAMVNLKARYDGRVTFGKEPYEVLSGADVLCLLTEWRVFRTPDWDRVKKLMRRAVVIDGRNQYDPRDLSARGIECYGIGRGLKSSSR